MVRTRVPAATAVAVMALSAALSACGSIHGSYGQPGGAGTFIDAQRFPPPPPMPKRPMAPVDAGTGAQAGVKAGAQAGVEAAAELAHLDATLTRLAGEIEESRKHLADLEAEVRRARARIDVLLEDYGSAAEATPLPPRQPAEPEDRRPLVRLRYEQAARVDYSEEVRDAVWAALERLPDAVFDVVAVSPGTGAAAAGRGEDGLWLQAEDVAADLAAMGIEPNRLTLSSAVSKTASADEVHLYIR